MLTLLISALLFSFFIHLIWFGLGSFLTLNIPLKGRLEAYVVNIVVGYIVFTALVAVCALLGVRNLAAIISLALSVFAFVKYRTYKSLLPSSINIKLLLLIIIGVTLQSSFIVTSGWKYSDGYRFYSANAHDSLWHVSLIRHLSLEFPPSMPTFSGYSLKNYHYFYDLLVSEVYRLTFIDIFTLNYQLIPVFLSLFLGLSVFITVNRIWSDRGAALIAVFLTYATGSFGYLAQLFGYQVSNWETAFWVMQAPAILINPPFTISLITLGVGITLLTVLVRQGTLKLSVIISVLFGTLVGFKAYAGILVFGALALVALVSVLKKQNVLMPITSFVSIGLGLFIFFNTTDGASGSLLLEPGWYIKTMMEAADRLNNVEWELQRQAYAFQNNYLKLMYLWGSGFFIFLIGNLGVRCIGLYKIKDIKRFEIVETFLWGVSLVGVVLPMLFIQKGIVWNTIQFMYYSLYVLTFFAASVLSRILKNQSKPTAVLIIAIFALLAIPTTIRSVIEAAHIHRTKPELIISTDQIEAFTALNQEPSRVIIGSYSDIALLSAFTHHTSFFEDKTQASLIGINSTEREEVQKSIFCDKNKSTQEKLSVLKKWNISYIYFDKTRDCYPEQLALSSEVDTLYASPTVAVARLK